jgi:D-3-phosphoglycerate dehydrogenase
MGTYKILIADSIAKEGIDELKKHPEFEVIVNTKHTKEELIELIPPFHAVIIRSATKLTADVLQAAINLKAIARAGTGYDNIDVEECSKLGIVAMITPTGNSLAVAELTLGYMIDYARNISVARQSMVEGQWDKKRFEGTELAGKTLGILGLGRIGALVAKRAIAFEMNIIAFDKYISKERADEYGATLLEDFNDFLAKSDYISIHLPLTSETKNMIDAPQFEIMKPTSCVINISRGGIVNEETLVTALKEGKIGGACIDVFSKEPATPEEFKFIGLSNCITTPHLGASTIEAQIKVGTLAAEHIAQALLEKKYPDAVNLKQITSPR